MSIFFSYPGMKAISCRVMPLLAGLLLLVAFSSCRGDEVVLEAEYERLSDLIPNLFAAEEGMYLLNEGNMGSNKATLDYVDFRTSNYIRNLYPERNPSVVKELGDVGNDLQIYGSRLYAVINCSNKVEVMEAATGKRIGQVNIPNCRYIQFHEGMAYVSSYVGGVQTDINAPKGAVFKVDTASLQVLEQVTVGYQPEEMEIIGSRLYVANSGGYRAPNYDNTVSVIDLPTFRQVEKIPVGINLHRIRRDSHGQLWVSSRGDQKSVPSRIFVLAPGSRGNMVVTDTLDIPCSNMAIQGDSLYILSAAWDGKKNKVTYGIVNVQSHLLVSDSFITDGTEQSLTMPYGLAIHPVSGDIYITDAKNYVSSGTLYCYDCQGRMKWNVRTGNIPVSMAFFLQPEQEQ